MYHCLVWKEGAIMKQLIFERINKKLTLLNDSVEDTGLLSENIPILLKNLKIKKPLIVSRGGLQRSHIDAELKDINYVQFRNFMPNPTAEQVEEGLQLFKKENCDSIISIGGGSAIDVAKAIQAIGQTNSNEVLLNRLTQPNPMDIVHIAIPTTAGTGSESTHFATIYINKKKYSVSDEMLLPKIAILDPSLLATLPKYERCSTYLDAFCHSVESFWSMRSSVESREYSRKAINLLVENVDGYFNGNEKAFYAAITAANFAGRAINLTTTTAAHAMCYQLTSLYKISHGHAAAMCLPVVWDYLLEQSIKDEKLKDKLLQLAQIVCQNEDLKNPKEGLNVFLEMFNKANFSEEWIPNNKEDLDVLVSSVNLQRLSNFPISISSDDLKRMYCQTLWKEKM